jgi:hypothetical protein
MHGGFHSPHPGAMNSIASLVGNLRDTELLPAMLEHFRHERELVQHASLIERREYFFFRANLDQVARASRPAKANNASQHCGTLNARMNTAWIAVHSSA